MVTLLRIATGGAMLLAIAWLFYDPKWDSAIAATGAFGTFVGTLLIKKEKQNKQSQNITSGSNGIQAGRNIHMSNTTISGKSDGQP
ncbi:hypothetical protein AZA_32382 [Nitrospirillum viridazoti Y2]|uniref:hypothetical protein n=1 Tax=Nitrospirillum viridazoti TaxID=3144925 RepID=UPI0002265704|nr:hypothetical protein [Nitrospirillum amazonense]EGY02536.1 hypothetical protein AZA_32382 [Nitrospirillum amazonense Y2]